MLRVIRAHRAYAEYKKEKDDLEDSDDDDGPEKEEGWLFIDLNHLMKLYARLREKERMVALIFEVSLRSSFFDATRTRADWVSFRLDLIGSHCRATQGYHHHLLRSSRPGLQGC